MSTLFCTSQYALQFARIVKKLKLLIFFFLQLSIAQDLDAQPTKPTQSPSDDKNSAKIAYFLFMSTGESEKAVPLLKKIIAPQNIYILHMDKKMNTDEIEKTVTIVKKLNDTYKNIHLLPQYQASYLGIALVDIELTAMAYALSISQHWTHYFNLSPSDYPLLTQQQISSILGQFHKNLSFVHFQIARNQTVQTRFMKVFVDNAVLGFGDNAHRSTNYVLPSPPNLQILKGSQWKVLSREMAEYFAYSKDGWARRMLLFFGNSKIPNEHYFQTTICNSPRVKDLLRSAMPTYFNFQHKFRFEEREKGKKSPNLIHARLLYEALKQGSFFARKFGVDEDSQRMKKLLDELHDDKEITVGNTNFTQESVFENSIQYFYNAVNHGKKCDDALKQNGHKKFKF
eukprot:TRINITY_DN1452_c2_g1_i7.p1 TRINITY_DN1452_c2_g1~~TRINITY_DN1452_c2_g1_i7.p1  ORF type:complete len:415 (-),score=42.47 TRINITY_DN1452_c2_g1_i7:141-1337(-)